MADPCSDSAPADRPSPLDRAELALCAALGQIVADVELAVASVEDPSEELFDRLDEDLTMLGDGIDAFRRAVRATEQDRDVDVLVALRAALDALLGELEVPLTITTSLPADLPRLAVSRAEFVPLLERAMRALLEPARPGDQLELRAERHGPDTVRIDLALIPVAGPPTAALAERFAARSVTLCDFVEQCGGGAGLRVDDGFRIALEFSAQSADRS